MSHPACVEWFGKYRYIPIEEPKIFQDNKYYTKEYFAKQKFILSDFPYKLNFFYKSLL